MQSIPIVHTVTLEYRYKVLIVAIFLTVYNMDRVYCE